MKIKTFCICLVFAALPLYADNMYTITVRGLNNNFPLLAWQMTYQIKAAVQGEAEQLALEKAKKDGCQAASAHIVEVTVALIPGSSEPQQPPAPALPPVIIVNPAPATVPQIPAQPQPPAPQPTPAPPPPHIEYQEAYQAGLDHGITGFLTGKSAGILNSEVPEKYRLAEQEQAYKNGYARGFADEKAKAEQVQAAKQQPPAPQPRQPSPRANTPDYRR